jgi:biotin-(acetyl-CoA carboxylase) ligase
VAERRLDRRSQAGRGADRVAAWRRRLGGDRRRAQRRRPPTGTATSLLVEGAADATVEAARGALNHALGHWLDAPESDVLAEFRARDALAGRRVGWERDAGVVAGIDDSGHLLVDTDRGERVALGAGEVHLAVS